MYRRIAVALALLALALVPLAAWAQEEAPRPFVYATYHVCNLADQWLADAIAKHVYEPAYEAARSDGALAAWGWLAHHTGGRWRRVIYHVAPTMEALLAAPDAIDAKIGADGERAAQEIGRLCPAHDDYIWRFVAGHGGAAEMISERGEAGFSVYYICDEAREERADELVKTTLAPVWESHVGSGKLLSWSWLEHWVGGEYRRLLTLSAADQPTLLKARDAAIGELVEQHEAAMEEFGSICNSHQDYMWEIQMEHP